jgi:hypothetical protein
MNTVLNMLCEKGADVNVVFIEENIKPDIF